MSAIDDRSWLGR